MSSRLDYRGAAAPLALTNGLGDTDTSFLVTGDTSGWPTGASGRSFELVIDRGTAKEEKILASSLTTGTVVVALRGYDGTSGKDHDQGATVEHFGPSATKMDDLDGHVYDPTRDDHTQYARIDGTRPFTGLGSITGTPVAVGGTTEVSGSSLFLSRADHGHGIAAGGISDPTMFASQVVGSAAIETGVIGGALLDPTTTNLLAAIVPTVVSAIVAGAVTLTSAAYVDFGPSTTVTVPAWATQAVVTTHINGWSSAGDSQGGQFKMQTDLGSQLGAERPLNILGTEGDTLSPTWVDLITGLTAGSVTLKTQAKRVGGSGSLKTITSTGDFCIRWLP